MARLNPLPFREIKRRLEAAGFVEASQKGSHVKFVRRTGDLSGRVGGTGSPAQPEKLPHPHCQVLRRRDVVGFGLCRQEARRDQDREKVKCVAAHSRAASLCCRLATAVRQPGRTRASRLMRSPSPAERSPSTTVIRTPP
ncbi:MAG: type II toxin-antitoxin system HicA family toxin [Bryobacteraceae bacterium]|nr:type II toxin-antitoxin system HicA family toxin [Bryobacteraceae bacterium]